MTWLIALNFLNLCEAARSLGGAADDLLVLWMTWKYHGVLVSRAGSLQRAPGQGGLAQGQPASSPLATCGPPQLRPR